MVKLVQGFLPAIAPELCQSSCPKIQLDPKYLKFRLKLAIRHAQDGTVPAEVDIGRETVRYVANIRKYYIAYKLADDKLKKRSAVKEKVRSKLTVK